MRKMRLGGMGAESFNFGSKFPQNGRFPAQILYVREKKCLHKKPIFMQTRRKFCDRLKLRGRGELTALPSCRDAIVHRAHPQAA